MDNIAATAATVWIWYLLGYLPFAAVHTEIRDGFARVLMSKRGRKNEAVSPRACTRSSAHVHPWHPKVWRHPSHHLQDAELSTRDTHWATPDETPKSPAKLCLKPPTGHSVTSQRKLCSSHDLQQLDVNKPRLVQGLELKQPKSAVFSKSILSNLLWLQVSEAACWNSLV